MFVIYKQLLVNCTLPCVFVTLKNPIFHSLLSELCKSKYLIEIHYEYNNSQLKSKMIFMYKTRVCCSIGNFT